MYGKRKRLCVKLYAQNANLFNKIPQHKKPPPKQPPKKHVPNKIPQHKKQPPKKKQLPNKAPLIKKQPPKKQIPNKAPPIKKQPPKTPLPNKIPPNKKQMPTKIPPMRKQPPKKLLPTKTHPNKKQLPKKQSSNNFSPNKKINSPPNNKLSSNETLLLAQHSLSTKIPLLGEFSPIKEKIFVPILEDIKNQEESIQTYQLPDSPRSHVTYQSFASSLVQLPVRNPETGITNPPIVVSNSSFSPVKCCNIYVIGDEHALYGWDNFDTIFNSVHMNSLGTRFQLKIYCVGPKLMYTMARDGFKNMSNKLPNQILPHDFLVFVFGELDIKCHLLKWAELRNKTIVQASEELCQHYLSKIYKHFGNNMSSPSQIIIRSVLPPCADKGDNMQQNETLSQQIVLTSMLNRMMEEKCKKYGFLFANINPFYTDKYGFLDQIKTKHDMYIDNNFSYDNIKVLSEIIKS